MPSVVTDRFVKAYRLSRVALLEYSMSSPLNVLSAKGAWEILLILSTKDAKFKELNQATRNTRTLSRRLRELESAGWIERAGGPYSITEAGFEALMRFYEMNLGRDRLYLNASELEKVPYDWIRIPLTRVVGLFLKEFGSELISLALYGSSARGSFVMGESDLDLLYVVEDDVHELWLRESEVFRRFQSSYEYTAFNRWFKQKGLYGYPEVSATHLGRSSALRFQPVYLDMIESSVIPYDRSDFLGGILGKLRNSLVELGAQRVERADGLWYWVLKPNLRPGEVLEIKLVD